jgi:hypothetical protein
MQDASFYRAHLEKVSRSFSYSILQLSPPFRDWTALAYLLCRALDTVEDAAWEDRSLQAHQFATFATLLRNPATTDVVQRWADAFPRIPDEERALLNDFHVLLSELHRMPVRVRGSIQNQ